MRACAACGVLGWLGLERSEAPEGQEPWRRPNQRNSNAARARSPPGLPLGPAPATQNATPRCQSCSTVAGQLAREESPQISGPGEWLDVRQLFEQLARPVSRFARNDDFNHGDLIAS